MAQQPQIPSQEKFNGFANRLKSFRETLPQDEQPMLDAMVAAAFHHDDKPTQNDVQGYWWVRPGVPYAYPAWYGAPVYAGTPWVAAYTYGYPVFYP